LIGIKESSGDAEKVRKDGGRHPATSGASATVTETFEAMTPRMLAGELPASKRRGTGAKLGQWLVRNQ